MVTDCKKLCQDVIKENLEFLKTHPVEERNSVGFVAMHLKPEHVEAALWMKDQYIMDVDTHNLHDTIVSYSSCKMMSKMELCINPYIGIKDGRFNPEQLIMFFKAKSKN